MAISRGWVFQKSFLRKTYNHEVLEWFSDIANDNDEDNITGRKATRDACLIKPNDSQNMTLIKMLTFRYQIQEVHLRPHVYGLPVHEYQEYNPVFHPQVYLYFEQDADSVPSGKRPVRAELNFRLRNETYKTVTHANARQLALKIKAEFATNNGYRFSKGKYLCFYIDKEKMYHLQVLAISETEGKEVFRKILEIQGDTLEEDNFKFTTPAKDPINNPGSETVFGESVKKRRWRPTATVRFRYATLKLYGLDNEIPLVDRSGNYRAAYEKLY